MGRECAGWLGSYPRNPATVLAATGDLAVRKSVWSQDVSHWSRAEHMRNSGVIDSIVGDWVVSKGLDGAVWRAAAARDYFERMPEQIRTPFQALAEREFGWKAATIPLPQRGGEPGA